MRIGFWWRARKKETTRKTKTYVEDNIKMDLREIGWSCMDLIDLAQDKDQWRPLVKPVIKVRVP
jgi:hypothetical protein